MTRAAPVVALILSVMVGRPAGAGPRQELPPPPVPAPQAAAQPDFDEFLDQIRAEARRHGISDRTLVRALGGLTPEPVVVARDRAQPELTQSLDEYLDRRLTPKVVANARAALAAQRDLLASIESTYGVPPPIITAIWGLESNFGRFTGAYSTIRSLATLAYDARRPLFRAELFDALAIVERGDADPLDLKGSWAGAMGQPQFMPSSYLAYAVDFDRDGRPNIWTSTSDVFASMANFLRSKGWSGKGRWGREVSVTRAAMTRIDRQVAMRQSGCRATREMTVDQPLADWARLGVRLPGGAPLPNAPISASLVRGRRRNFLVYDNYGALLEYNCSNSYAVAIGLLADRIAR